MAGFFNFLGNILVIAATLCLIFISMQMVLNAPRMERWIRALAFAAGLLLFIGARAAGLDAPALFFRAMNQQEPLIFTAAGIIGPGAMGTLIGWRLVDNMNKQASFDKIVRVNILLTTFFVIVFGDVYATSLHQTRIGEVDRLLVPNVCFVLGLAFFVIFKVQYGAQRSFANKQEPRSVIDRILDRK